ncbi:MAG: choice-of-anchor tandem repeat GloVer-containing protein [Limisphaerales bacterium]
MKRTLRHAALLLAAIFAVAPEASATLPPNFTPIYSFTNTDGSTPVSGMILASNVLYGTTAEGGQGSGVAFAVNTDGSNYTVLHSFAATDLGTNADGARPSADLLLSGGTLYGTTMQGGSCAGGTVFAVNTDGSNFRVLHQFTTIDPDTGTNSGGAFPLCSLIISEGVLYGAASGGGPWGGGTIFRLNSDGTDFTNLYSFAEDPFAGALPYGGLVLSSGVLYGTSSGYTSWMGPTFGSIFSMRTDGTGFTNLHLFTGYPYDGAYPLAGLIVSGNTLYGTTFKGGSDDYGHGTVFAINTDGTGYTILHDFLTREGEYPCAGLLLSDQTLYGTANQGGAYNGVGTIFALSTNGDGFVRLCGIAQDPIGGYNYDTSGGCNPYCDLVLLGNQLYGSASAGGAANYGSIFSLSLTPSLEFSRMGAQLGISWPTWGQHLALETTTSLPSGPWNEVTNEITVTGVNYTTTNSLDAPTKFFRLHARFE